MKKPVLQMAATADSLWLPSPWPKHFLLSNRILFVFEVAMGPDSETQFQVSLQRHMALTSVVASLNEDSYFSDRLQAGGEGSHLFLLVFFSREHRPYTGRHLVTARWN